LAERVSRNSDLEVAARELIDSANEQDGSDNISVQIVRIRSVERMGMYRGRPYKLR
jgi:serine/threonine protein phosphatase PrpC